MDYRYVYVLCVSEKVELARVVVSEPKDHFVCANDSALQQQCYQPQTLAFSLVHEKTLGLEASTIQFASCPFRVS